MIKINSNLHSRAIDLGVAFHSSVDKVKMALSIPNKKYENLVRFGKGRFYGSVDKYICYLTEKDGEYIIPRYFFGEPGIDYEINYVNFIDSRNYGRRLTAPDKERLDRMKFPPRDYQQKFLDDHYADIETHSGILIEAACGSGKTFMGIYISIMRNKQTLVLVPTYYLAQQWKERIEQFTDCSVQILSSADKEIRVDTDFTIMVMDLFSCRVLPEKLIKNIGHVILDEAHRVGAETYIPILDEIPAFYRTALTATFRREDGVHKILKYHFGQYMKMDCSFPRPLVYGLKTGVVVQNVLNKNKVTEDFIQFLEQNNVRYVETPSVLQYESDSSELQKKVDAFARTATMAKKIKTLLNKGSELTYTTIDTYLNESSPRRKKVISLITKCMEAGRTVLFLSKRKDVLKSLHKYFSKYEPMLIISETGKRTEEEQNFLQNKCRLVFGVTQLAKEGLDIDRLDTLIIHLPMKDTEQAIGRISRVVEGKPQPICFYLLDECPITFSVFMKAKKFFKINAEYKKEISICDVEDLI